MARQTLLIRELFVNFEKTNPVTDAEIKAEYDKVAASNSGKEYRTSHILVETEDQAKALIADIKAGKKNLPMPPNKPPKTPAQEPKAATWAGPPPTATCPSSPRP